MKLKLHEMVRSIVENILTEAHGRQQYVEDIVDEVTGALGEHYKALYAELNGLATEQDIAYWRKEVDGRFTALRPCLLRAEKGIRRGPAFDEAMVRARTVVPRKIAWAKSQIVKKFNVKERSLINEPSDQDTDELFARLDNLWDELFPE